MDGLGVFRAKDAWKERLGVFEMYIKLWWDIIVQIKVVQCAWSFGVVEDSEELLKLEMFMEFH